MAVESTASQTSKAHNDNNLILQSSRRLRMIEHHWIPTGDESVQIRTNDRVTIMKGAAVSTMMPKLLPLLDGTLTAGQFLNQGAALVGAENAERVLTLLLRKGLIEEVLDLNTDLFPNGIDAHYQSLSSYFLRVDRSGDRFKSLEALRRARVMIVDEGLDTDSLVTGLCQIGIGSIVVLGTNVADVENVEDVENVATIDPRDTDVQTAELPTTVDEWIERLRDVSLVIVGVRGFALYNPRIFDINQASIETRTPWLSIAIPSASSVQIGPYVVPGQSACIGCYRHQFASSTSFLQPLGFLENLKNDDVDTELTYSPLSFEIAANLAVIEAVRAITSGQNPVSAAMVVTFDINTMSFDHFKILKNPRCPECGAARGRPTMRIWG